MSKLLSICLFLICLLVLGLCATNLQSTSIAFVSAKVNAPLGVVIIGAFTLGLLISTSFFSWSKAHSTNQENHKLQEWQIQDAKLAAQVKSEREKQLEAKIVTLESALKTALKKNS